MSTHSHHDHDHAGCSSGSIGDRMVEAERLCARRGVKLTGQRATVLEALLDAGKALGAYDLIERMQAAGGGRIAPITIYRALNFLVENNLVHRIESRNAFLACPEGHGTHPEAVFLICEACGRVGEVTSPELESGLASLAAERGFSPRTRVIEISGTCAACATGLAR
ncbi:MAG: transcriptional repressor [Proteobacteria bacterium]|nr:transcriptional repressor [Pseudomonadota bacterium]